MSESITPATYVPSTAVHTLVEHYISTRDCGITCAGSLVHYGIGYAIDHLVMAESSMTEEDTLEYVSEMITEARLGRA